MAGLPNQIIFILGSDDHPNDLIASMLLQNTPLHLSGRWDPESQAFLEIYFHHSNLCTKRQPLVDRSECRCACCDLQELIPIFPRHKHTYSARSTCPHKHTGVLSNTHRSALRAGVGIHCSKFSGYSWERSYY